MSEIVTESREIPAASRAVRVTAGELAAFGLAMEEAEKVIAGLRGQLAAARETVAAEIEAEAAGHLHSIRRAMRWAAWVARGKPPESDPGNDHQLSGALLRGDAERTSAPCCPVETAAAMRAVAAERKRIRAAADDLKVTLGRPGNGPAHTQALDVVPLADLLRLLEGGTS